MSYDRTSVVRDPVYGSGGTFAYTAAAGNSADLPLETMGVWVWCTTDAYVRLGPSAPAATVTDWPIPQGQMVWVPVQGNPQTPVQLSAIRVTADGTAYFIPGV